MPHILDCPVLSNEQVAPDHFRVHFEAPQIAREAGPAQFCMMQVQPGYYPLLRRPMSFEQIFDESLTVLYKTEGEGTEMLSRFIAGQLISIQGPLGRGFPVEDQFDRHIIVAGGIGVAPFPALARSLVESTGRAPEVLLAARTEEYVLCEDLFREIGCPIQVVTDDGSRGERGYAKDLLEETKPGPRDRIYLCGPMIMMWTCAEVARNAGANCLAALEAQMACGDGACLGCVVESVRELEGEKMIRVCCDGPVVAANLVDWRAHNMAYDR